MYKWWGYDFVNAYIFLCVILRQNIMFASLNDKMITEHFQTQKQSENGYVQTALNQNSLRVILYKKYFYNFKNKC